MKNNSNLIVSQNLSRDIYSTPFQIVSIAILNFQILNNCIVQECYCTLHYFVSLLAASLQVKVWEGTDKVLIFHMQKQNKVFLGVGGRTTVAGKWDARLQGL